MGLASRVSIFLIKGYKYIISPFLGRSCRFDPSCSSYALEAFSKYGFFLGFKLSIKRIARCHPWGNHGYDPLPEINDDKRKTR